jgi:phenylacetaldehyde dehydrogenase
MSAVIAEQLSPSQAVSAFLARRPQIFVGGEWIDSESDTQIPVIDPATERTIAVVADANSADVDKAVRAARSALEKGDWAYMLPAQRQALIWRLADLIEANADELAELESLDNGKTKFMASIVDVGGTVEYFRYMAGWATKIEGATIDVSVGRGGPDPRYQAYTRREPVGVVGQIIPWNFPLAMAAWKLGPALAAGCTCVLKPAEQTPLTALRLGELIQEAGFPPGVVNILSGYGESTGAAIVSHPGIDKIAFTGSGEVGRLINKQATDSLKRVSLELGGKSPVIMLSDMDIETAVGGAAQAIFFNAGQVCAAGSRLYVQKDIFDSVLEGVGEAANSIRLGPGLAPDTEMGPLVSSEQQERVLNYIDSGRSEGASIVAGGERLDHPGYFVKPTVMAGVRNDMRVVQEEIFGPVLVAERFNDLDEIADVANGTSYGLSASIWSNDLKAVNRLIPKIKAGTVWVNCHGFVDPNMPFGGFKQSGFGRESGRGAIEMYTEVKSVLMQI